MGDDLADKQVLVLGGPGHLKDAIAASAKRQGAKQVVTPDASSWPSMGRVDSGQALADHFKGKTPDVVIHLARCWDEDAAELGPADLCHQTLDLALSVAEGCCQCGMADGGGKLVFVGTADSYPKLASVPWREADLWNGYPDPSLAAGGVAARAVHALLDSYRTQHGLRSAYLLPITIYGPGGAFGATNGTDLVPTLISRFIDAAEAWDREIVCEGSGSPTRDFLFVDDAAEAIVRAAVVLDDPTPMNIGTGIETALRHVTQLITQFVGYRGQVRWDKTKPDGMPRRLVDVGQAKRLLGWEASTTLRPGLKKCIAWHRANRLVAGEPAQANASGA